MRCRSEGKERKKKKKKKRRRWTDDCLRYLSSSTNIQPWEASGPVLMRHPVDDGGSTV